MNIPNALTSFRIVLIPLFVLLLLDEQYLYSLIVLVLAGLTDGLDGIVARVTNQRTRLGAVLDPLADKLLLSSAFVTLAALGMIPLWVAVLVVARDVLLMTGTIVFRLAETPLEIAPSLVGKGTTVLQLSYIVVVILLSAQGIDSRFLDPLLYLTVAFTVLSGSHYLYRAFTGPRSHEA